MSDVGALLYLVQHPDVDLRAITLAGTGESSCAAGVSNTAALLELVGHAPVPIACGQEQPVGQGNEWPPEWSAASDELAPLQLPHVEVPDADGGAVQLLVDMAAATDGLLVIALGPLTNLALAVEKQDGFAGDVGQVFTMGGAIAVDGNAPNGTAEWNYFIDPTSVDVVLHSGLPVTVVPLDATNDLPSTRSWWRRLAEPALDDGNPAAKVIYELWANATPWQLGFYLWDELTAIVALDPGLATTSTERLSIVTTGADAGRTVVSADGAPVQVVAHPDRRDVEDELFRRLAGP